MTFGRVQGEGELKRHEIRYAMPAGIAGQIGRIADFHGSAARRVRDRDVPNASSAMDGNWTVAKVVESMMHKTMRTNGEANRMNAAPWRMNDAST